MNDTDSPQNSSLDQAPQVDPADLPQDAPPQGGLDLGT